MNLKNILEIFDIKEINNSSHDGSISYEDNNDKVINSLSPIDGSKISSVQMTSHKIYNDVVDKAVKAAPVWSSFTAPYRGEIVRQYGQILRKHKKELGSLVCLEMGKSYQEALGEVQEMIDICDFAVGLSRQLYGLSMHSERPKHRMFEQWHPLGVVGIISAFNFPVAVWSWNAMIALICGNTCIWKPSEKAPISALACQKLLSKIIKENNLPAGISCLVNGDKYIGEQIASDSRISLVSATGSTKMGKNVAVEVSKRLGKYLLELGGNNAVILTENADLNVAIPSIVFGAVGTAGQRCTTTRRLIVHKSILETVTNKLINAYGQLKIGNPMDEDNHLGPLVDNDASELYMKAIEQCKKEGGEFVVDGGVLKNLGDNYVKPCIAIVDSNMKIVKEETFAPILYVMPYDDLQDAIKIQNSVSQGLSSAIMSINMRETEQFLSSSGSDCGIANVNIGTSGAEIGGAFGGEKDTGGGRESGSDSWKSYMRRQTVTTNYSQGTTLAQGIKFNI